MSFLRRYIAGGTRNRSVVVRPDPAHARQAPLALLWLLEALGPPSGNFGAEVELFEPLVRTAAVSLRSAVMPTSPQIVASCLGLRCHKQRHGVVS